MSEQHGPDREKMQPEPRWIKRRRDKDEPWRAEHFQPNQLLVAEYRARSGRTVRLLVQVEDVYEHDILHQSWDTKVALFARVRGVQEEDQKPLVGRIVSVNLDRSGMVWFSRIARLRDDLDPKQESWL